MRGFVRSILHRLLGAGGYVVINPAAYEALRNTLAETKGGLSQLQQQVGEIGSHMAALRGEVVDMRERLLETKGGVSQLQQQSGDTFSHMVALRGEVSEFRERVAETKGGVSRLQGESGEALSHILALRRELSETGGSLAETQGVLSQAQSQLGETLSRVMALLSGANGSGGRAQHDHLHTLPLQLDLAANRYVKPDLAGSEPPGESHALAVHYARLANLVAQHWVAGADAPPDPYSDDDLSPEYARIAIGDGANGKIPDGPESGSSPWRQLWADPDCGVLLVLGEGNAANHGEVRHTSLGDVFSLDFRTLRCCRAQDPLAGATGQRGSLWSRLGDRLIDSGVFRRVLFLPLASEGSSVKDWTPEGAMHRRTALTLSRLRKQLGLSVLPFSAVLWQQGETEANRSLMSAQAYKMHFHDMVADLRANGVFAPVFAACATLGDGGAGGGQNRANVRRALLELPDPEGGIFAGPDIDAIGAEHRFDGGHFSERGLARGAELWHDALTPRRRLIEKLVVRN